MPIRANIASAPPARAAAATRSRATRLSPPGRWLARILPALLAAPCLAQSCAVPPGLAATVEPVPPGEVVRVPTVSYKLALSWSPEFCRRQARNLPASRLQRQRDAANPVGDQAQCAGRYGFILHGLWPDGANAVHPRYCAPVGAVPPATLRQAYCATPSARLMQHEWQAHGSCGWPTPAGYFAQSTALYRQLRVPEVDALSTAGRVTAGDIRVAFGRLNPTLATRGMFIGVTRRGWLDEVRLCYDLQYRPIACDRQGAPDPVAVKVWRRGA